MHPEAGLVPRDIFQIQEEPSAYQFLAELGG